MTPQLPSAFTQRMQSLLPHDFEAFLDSYRGEAFHGLRVNTLKVALESFRQISPFPLDPISWCPQGFRYPDGVRPGKHPYHACGLYYLQEPSAMSPAEALGAQPGERILDLCAAPGGKSTQLAAALRGEGLLIANEIHPQRARILAENLERCAVRNAVVTNETPERLQERFPQFFDRILVDAPCSGEGMFRKLPEAISDWSEEKVAECHRMQIDILDAAARMLKPGGTLVYSTCTFAPLENEQSITSFLARHPEFSLIAFPHHECFAPGHPEWADPSLADLQMTARLWPHKLEGEGHFLAKLKKDEQHAEELSKPKRKEKRNGKALPAGKKKPWPYGAASQMRSCRRPLASTATNPPFFSLANSFITLLHLNSTGMASRSCAQAFTWEPSRKTDWSQDMLLPSPCLPKRWLDSQPIKLMIRKSSAICAAKHFFGKVRQAGRS